MLGGVGVRVKLIVGSEGRASFQVEGGVGRRRIQQLVVRHEETVGTVRPYGVPHRALPKYALKRTRTIIGVVDRRSDASDPANADDHPPAVLRERRAFGVEEA